MPRNVGIANFGHPVSELAIFSEPEGEGGAGGRGRRPRENHPPEGRHSIRTHTLAWHICFIVSNKPQFGKISMKTTMTAGRSAGAVEKSICYNVKVTDDW